MSSIQLCWFRRDLRLHDHAALFHALTQHKSVQPIFIFDSEILSELKADDKRVTFIYLQLQKMKEICQQHGSDLKIYYGKPIEVFAKIFSSNQVSAVYTNHDYEPYAIQRDQTIEALCKQHSIQFFSYKDQVIFEKNEVIKDDGTPYTVYTPYSKKWKLTLQQEGLPSFPSEKLLHNLHQCPSEMMLSLNEIGFELQENDFSSMIPDEHLIQHYQETRDYPGIEGTSRLGIHLRFGTLSIRQLTQLALKTNEKFLNELIWRDFYQAILWHFPQVVQQCFKPKYEDIQWRNHEGEFEAWCNGLTGYPIV
ncbi:MAG: deoxyribodipyrimidine photo-lyase, partial [Chitinophagaceae bacterium]|nr:deoxyribodipyrimidine photo-lyase [Chitinophagaceae bacterium]